MGVSKIGKVFLFGGLAICYIIALIFGGLAFFPVTPITYTRGSMPFKILNVTNGQKATVTAGQILIYEVRYCRNTDAPADVQRTIIGAVSVTLNRTISQAEKKCGVSKVANTVVPSYLPPGKYHMDITIVYHINPIKDVTVLTRTETFTVVAPPVDENGNVVPQPIIIPENNNKPGTINGGSLDDEEIRNQVSPPQSQSTNKSASAEPAPNEQSDVAQTPTPQPQQQQPAEPPPGQITTPSTVSQLVCRLSLGLLLCR